MPPSAAAASVRGTSDSPSDELITLTNTGSYLTLDSPVNLTPGSPATALATIDNGSGTLASIALTSPGSGYLAPPTVTITGGGGSGATASASIDAETGQVTGLSLISAGSGYTSAPTVVLSDPVAQATAVAQLNAQGDGTVSKVDLTSPAPATSSRRRSQSRATARVRQRLRTLIVRGILPRSWSQIMDRATPCPRR